MTEYNEHLQKILQTDTKFLEQRLSEVEQAIKNMSLEREVIFSLLRAKKGGDYKETSNYSAKIEEESHSSFSRGGKILGEAKLTAADLAYNNMRFKISSEISKNLPQEGKINIIYGNENVEGTIPPSVRGRVNGVHLYKNFRDVFKIGSKVKVELSLAENTLTILSVEN